METPRSATRRPIRRPAGMRNSRRSTCSHDGSFAAGFATIDISKRRDLIAAQIDHERARLTASPLDAVHVAVALLAFWADSSAATDLVYGARIGKGECRVLADAPRRPLPLGNGGRS
jgi:hypothetical protein